MRIFKCDKCGWTFDKKMKAEFDIVLGDFQLLVQFNVSTITTEIVSGGGAVPPVDGEGTIEEMVINNVDLCLPCMYDALSFFRAKALAARDNYLANNPTHPANGA